MSEPPTVEQLETALRTVTDLIMERRRKRVNRSTESEELVIFSATELMATPDAVLAERSIVRDPVEYFLRKGVHRIGQALYERVGLDGLQVIVERTAEPDYDHRIGFLDHAMEGVGRSAGNAGWCA